METDEDLIEAEAVLVQLTAAMMELIPGSASPEKAMAGLERLHWGLAEHRC